MEIKSPTVGSVLDPSELVAFDQDLSLVGDVTQQDGHTLSILELFVENSAHALERSIDDLDVIADFCYVIDFCEADKAIALARLNLLDKGGRNRDGLQAVAQHGFHAAHETDQPELRGKIKEDKTVAREERRGTAVFEQSRNIDPGSGCLEERLDDKLLLGLNVDDEPSFHDQTTRSSSRQEITYRLEAVVESGGRGASSAQT